MCTKIPHCHYMYTNKIFILKFRVLHCQISDFNNFQFAAKLIIGFAVSLQIIVITSKILRLNRNKWTYMWSKYFYFNCSRTLLLKKSTFRLNASQPVYDLEAIFTKSRIHLKTLYITALYLTKFIKRSIFQL